ncbi:hypothetical protein NEOKW01_1501 [Nematocida sp. AWRm80]|nr:hypothetical protein NEOKW01_1501 [Nematocida sp. AWRm80]
MTIYPIKKIKLLPEDNVSKEGILKESPEKTKENLKNTTNQTNENISTRKKSKTNIKVTNNKNNSELDQSINQNTNSKEDTQTKQPSKPQTNANHPEPSAEKTKEEELPKQKKERKNKEQVQEKETKKQKPKKQPKQEETLFEEKNPKEASAKETESETDKTEELQKQAEEILQANTDVYTLSDAKNLSEMLDIAYAQEIETKYISVIETLILKLFSNDLEKIWLYGPKIASDHIIRVISNATARQVATFRRRTKYNIQNIYQFDIGAYPTVIVRNSLYKMLEKTNPLEILGNKFIFQISSTTAINKLDKRITSRMEGTKVYIKEFNEKEYNVIFSRTIEALKERSPEAFDYPEILKGLEEFIHKSHLIDNGYKSMKMRFFKYLYQIEEPNIYSILNSIHLIILLASTIKRITFSGVYEEFERRVSNISHFKTVSKDIVFRRTSELMELGLIARGYFVQDLQELELEIHKREEVYLKVILERVKRFWK